MQDRETYLAKVCEDLANLRVAKNNDYGSAYTRHGLTGIVIRMWDKYARLENLTLHKTTAMVKETVKDTLLDLVNYGLLGLWELEQSERRAKQEVQPQWEKTFGTTEKH